MLLAGLAAGAEVAGGKWRVAVIGHTGRGDFGHGLDTMWLDLPETEVVAFADAGGLEKGAAKLPGVKGFADYRVMLEEVKPDLVSIAARHIGEHRDMALAAIAAGAKGIYMEKPFCRDLREAREIVEAAEKKGVKIALAHRNRYHPALPVARKLVEDGTIGRVLEIRGRGKEDHRGGVQDLWVLGSHVFNLAVYFAGELLDCSATLMKTGKPAVKGDVTEGKEDIGPVAGDELHARFGMESGVPFYFDSIANAGTKEGGFGLQLIGTEGIMDLRIDTEPLVHVMRGNPFHPSGPARSWTPVTSGGLGVAEPLPGIGKLVGGHVLAARDLIGAIQEKRAPLCSAEDGMQTVAMTLAVLESHRQGGARVGMPLEVETNPLVGWE